MGVPSKFEAEGEVRPIELVMFVRKSLVGDWRHAT